VNMKEQEEPEFYTLDPRTRTMSEHGLLWVKEDSPDFMLEIDADIWAVRSVATGAPYLVHKNRLTPLCK